MRLGDYGETIECEVCNVLWQKIESQKFAGLYRAWLWAKVAIENGMIKFLINHDGGKFQIRVWKSFASSKYFVQPMWAHPLKVDSLSDVYDTMCSLYPERE